LSTSGRRARRRLFAALFTACSIAGGCGSNNQGAGDATGDIQAIVGQVRHAKPGEILIIGRRPVRFSGPYMFVHGGYVLRFRQAASRGEPRLRISLESRRASRRMPYQSLVDTKRPQGRAVVTVGGRLFVHVVTNSSSYVLRFTPKRRDR
jgi:hypothetical protein